jgi:hypothetical protein
MPWPDPTFPRSIRKSRKTCGPAESTRVCSRRALLKRGYPDVAIARIIGGNFMKLFREVTEGAG